MARYIDADKVLEMTSNYKSELGRLKADPFVKHGIEVVEGFIRELVPTADVILIPDNATNGDMIKALFPNVRLSYNGLGDRAIFDGDHYIASTDWWDAPYKAESERKIEKHMPESAKGCPFNYKCRECDYSRGQYCNLQGR